MAVDVQQTFDWLNPAATLVAAFGGTFFAFTLEHVRQKREEVARQLSAARRAIYVLSDMLNVVVQYRKEIVEPYVGKADAWLNMNVSNVSGWEVMKFDDAGVAFILDSTEANFFAELLLEQRRFFDFRSVVAQRDGLLLDRVFPALGSKIPVGSQIDQNKFAELLGHHIEHELRILTTAIFEKSESLAKTLPLAHDKLRDVIAKIHPEKKLLKFVIDS